MRLRSMKMIVSTLFEIYGGASIRDLYWDQNAHVIITTKYQDIHRVYQSRSACHSIVQSGGSMRREFSDIVIAKYQSLWQGPVVKSVSASGSSQYTSGDFTIELIPKHHHRHHPTSKYHKAL